MPSTHRLTSSHHRTCSCPKCKTDREFEGWTRRPRSRRSRSRRSPSINVRRAVQRNRYWAHRLGWAQAFGSIVPLVGFRNQTPTPAAFAQAVAHWQRANGLTMDGILGPNTWRTMRRALGGSSGPSRPTGSAAPRADVPDIPLGSLTLKSKQDPTRTVRMYRFTPEDLLVTARMLEGENSGKETLETEGIMWSMLNLYAFIQHHRQRSYPTFAALLYKYSSPLFPGRSLRNRAWNDLRPSSRKMAILGLQGRLRNPVGNATDFANPYIYFKRRYGRTPNRREWLNYIANHSKNYLKWIGPIEGIKQYGRNTFYINKRLLRVPPGVVEVR